jgi:hypothetical protein
MQTISKQQFRKYIEDFDFTSLFNVLGWNYLNEKNPVRINENTFIMYSVAEKSGFRILVCEPDKAGKIPDYSTRVKLDRAISRLYREHLIVFQDLSRTTQLWQMLMRAPGTPDQLTQTLWNRGQEPELLYQRTSGLFFTLEEEDKITIVDVTQRVTDNFHQNREKVTKKFYEGFKKEHKAFLGFIKGIADQANQEWYASLMLNRLMFCYFIQKQGFLDNNKNYLRDKLKSCQEKKGKNKFYSFYRDFLLALFHQGLGAPAHSTELQAELGRIPYLNGGLFDVHRLEREYKEINIDDKAFESIFTFFDQWDWHLDSHQSASGKDVDPDVIGYIFEKYINDRAQMGAYYTKEDITDYISKNCIIPYLFDETARQYSKAFHADGEIWSMLKKSGDAYVYDAVKYGINPADIWGDLPDDVQAGLDPEQTDLVEKRCCWNRSAPAEVALPTEIWREVIERRKRYVEVTTQIKNGAINHINDFITYNLNIRQFAQDLLTDTEDPKLIMRFYQALNTVTILDPTCGSGAFLFAAMNILERLYETCLLRMDNFVAEDPPGKHKFFEETLARVNAPEHPNRKYFIYKNIILQNLYGVDIMHEAVEIAKLRLFLKLVATVDPDYHKLNMGLEPLPDIDYNIRAGNTLVGYASESELDSAFAGQLDFDDDAGKIKERCDTVARTFARYKEIQLTYGDDYQQFKQAKTELDQRLQTLNHDLNVLLHKQSSGLKYNTWLKTHQPFHWLAEFYEIINDRSGFDVVIGNPPYVVYSQNSLGYTLRGYKTLGCKDLYSFVIERATNIVNRNGSIGMIVPISIVSTDGFFELRQLLNASMENIWYSSFSMRPGKLFEGVEKHLSIFISIRNPSGKKQIISSKYYRWYSEERDYLFSRIKYECIDKSIFHNDSIPKIGSTIESKLIKKLKTNHAVVNSTVSESNYVIYHTRKLRYFLQFLDTPPKIYEENGETRITSELKNIYFLHESTKYIALGAYLSSLFFWYYIAFSDCRNLNKREVMTFPLSLDSLDKQIVKLLTHSGKDLMRSLQSNSYFQEAYYKKYGNLKMQVFQPRLSKPIVDQIDTALAKHYGFTPEELDFIINYDIKYRMGKELGGDEEEE